jgi:hypothetical protein
VLRSAAVGEWTAVDYRLQQEMATGSWDIISNTRMAHQEMDQWATVTAHGQYSQPSWYPVSCECNFPSLPQEPSAIPQDDGSRLTLMAKPQRDRALLFSRRGLQVDGDFGKMTTPDGLHYAIKQVNFHFPSTRRLPSGDLAVGEMHFVGVKAEISTSQTFRADDLMVAVILLGLPEEYATMTDTQRWFLNVGLGSLPLDGEPYDMPGEFDLSQFEHQFSLSASSIPCNPGAKMFVLGEPALVSGIVLEQFRLSYPDGQHCEEGTPEAEEEVIVVDSDAASEKLTRTYATGEWAAAAALAARAATERVAP